MLTTLATIICAVKAFDPSLRPRCLITGQATTGWNQVNSPQFPKPIPGKVECLYILSAPQGAKIELNFDQFELLGKKNPSCQRQGLALLDPFQTNVPGQTEIFCGLQKPVPYVSRGNKLYLKFESHLKAEMPGAGFLIKYRIRASKAGAAAASPGASAGGAPVKGAQQNKMQKNKAQKNAAQNNTLQKPKNAPLKPKANGSPKANGKPAGNRSGGKIMAIGGGAASRPSPQLKSTKPAAKNSAGRKPMLRQRPRQQPPSGPRANFHDMPVAEKRTKALGGKTDLDTKRMLKYLLIGLGSCAGAIVVFLIFRKMTGKDSGGIPEPEFKLPEGTLPTHMRAIQEHKEKMKSLGKDYKEED